MEIQFTVDFPYLYQLLVSPLGLIICVLSYMVLGILMGRGSYAYEMQQESQGNIEADKEYALVCSVLAMFFWPVVLFFAIIIGVVFCLGKCIKFLLTKGI